MRLGFGIGISYPQSSVISGILKPPDEENTWLWNDNNIMVWNNNENIVIEENTHDINL